MMSQFTAMQEGISASKLELLLFKSLHFLTFKKSSWLEIQIAKITQDLETVKNKKVF